MRDGIWNPINKDPPVQWQKTLTSELLFWPLTVRLLDDCLCDEFSLHANASGCVGVDGGSVQSI